MDSDRGQASAIHPKLNKLWITRCGKAVLKEAFIPTRALANIQAEGQNRATIYISAFNYLPLPENS